MYVREGPRGFVRHTYPLVLSKSRLECERDKELVHACLRERERERERERTSVQERFCAKNFLQMKENKFSLRHHLKKSTTCVKVDKCVSHYIGSNKVSTSFLLMKVSIKLSRHLKLNLLTEFTRIFCILLC